MSPLRRTPMPPRSKPLTSSKPLPRGTGLSRSTSLPRKAPGKGAGKPRVKPLSSARPKVTPAEKAGKDAVKARSGGRCEIGTGCVGQEVHHRKNRSQGGTWCPSNLLHLCSRHHLHVGTNPAASRQQGWAVRSTEIPADVPVWLAGKGFHFLTPDGDVVPAERSAA